MLKQDIEQQIKEALKAHEELRLSTLRLLLSAIKNDEIAKQKEATDDDVIAVTQKQIKQRLESIEAFHNAGRTDLEQKERDEMAILSTFVPQQFSEEEIRKISEEVRASLPESDRNNFGKVMGMVMGRVKGRADGNIVSKVVKELLLS